MQHNTGRASYCTVEVSVIVIMLLNVPAGKAIKVGTLLPWCLPSWLQILDHIAVA